MAISDSPSEKWDLGRGVIIMNEDGNSLIAALINPVASMSSFPTQVKNHEKNENRCFLHMPWMYGFIAQIHKQNRKYTTSKLPLKSPVSLVS